VSRLRAILSGRCPGCRSGSIFRGVIATHVRCPECGLRLLRETGYTVGAMYISYGLAVPILTLLALLVRWLAPAWELGQVLAVAAFLFIPLVPLVFRYARVLWIHFDRAVDPGDDQHV
jgi:uncharacterized protein (DUF983 family)